MSGGGGGGGQQGFVCGSMLYLEPSLTSVGCSEMLMAHAVAQLAEKTPGKEAIAIESFVRALRQVKPRGYFFRGGGGGGGGGEANTHLHIEFQFCLFCGADSHHFGGQCGL